MIDVPANVASERLLKRDGTNRRKFDKDIEFLEQVRENYLSLPGFLSGSDLDGNVVVVDGNQSIEGVWLDVKNAYRFVFKV